MENYVETVSQKQGDFLLGFATLYGVAHETSIDKHHVDKNSLMEQIRRLQHELATLEYHRSDGAIPLRDYATERSRLMAEYNSTLRLLCVVHSDKVTPQSDSPNARIS